MKTREQLLRSWRYWLCAFTYHTYRPYLVSAGWIHMECDFCEMRKVTR